MSQFFCAVSVFVYVAFIFYSGMTMLSPAKVSAFLKV